jgi:hypothetical protein
MAWNGACSGRLTVGHPNYGFGETPEDIKQKYAEGREYFKKMYEEGTLSEQDYRDIIAKLNKEEKEVSEASRKAESGDLSAAEMTNLIGKVTASLGKSAADMYLGFLQYKMQLRQLRSGGAAGSSLPMQTTPTYMTEGGGTGLSRGTLLMGALGIGAFILAVVALRK